MVTKATAERLIQLSRAAAGQETKRPVADILKSERSAAAQFVPPAQAVAPPAVVESSESSG